MAKNECDLCKRKIKGKRIGWILLFYNLKSLNICQECDMSIQEQIFDELTYFDKLYKKTPLESYGFPPR